MHTLKLKIHDTVFDKFMKIIDQFGKDEIEIITEKDEFSSVKKYLQSELNEIVSEKAVFYSFDETNKKLDKIIKNHENNL